MWRYNKYHAKKAVALNGAVCASRKERDRYNALLMREKAGEITDLRFQVVYELIPNQRTSKGVLRKCSYVADFVYIEDGKEVVEDSKGKKTREYQIKKKLMLWRYGIEIKET